MEMNAEKLIIKQGLDRENVFLLWTSNEWVVSIFSFGVLIIIHHILIGLFLMMLMLYFFLKFRSEERGHKSHILWRLSLWKSKKGFWWAPVANATRFDN